MADLTGAIYESIGGKEYALRLTMRGVAKLQAKHGTTIGGLLDSPSGATPMIEPLLDMVSEALQKGSGIEADRADDLADDLLTSDMSVVERILKAAFPDAEVESTLGNVRRPKRRG